MRADAGFARRHPRIRRRGLGKPSLKRAVAGAGQASRLITVALADQHHLIREGIRCLLETVEDFRVVGEVADGLKVVGLVVRRKPRVLVMASAMPGLNSLEVTLRVRRRSPATAVIVLSMCLREQDVIGALKSGASGYVVTQAKGLGLIRAIRRVAAGNRYLSAPLSERRIEHWLQRAKGQTLDPYDALTNREREVFNLVAEGHSSDNIAIRLSISRRTAESHRANIMRKLHLSNQTDLVRFAIDRGILTVPSPFPLLGPVPGRPPPN